MAVYQSASGIYRVDGNTDTIADALADISGSTGGLILALPGSHTIASKLSWKYGVTLLGAGRGYVPDPGDNTGVTVITGPASDYAIECAGIDLFGFENLKFYQSGLHIAASGSTPCTLFRLKSLVFNKMDGGAAAVYCVGGSTTIEHNAFSVEDITVRDANGASGGLFFRYCVDVERAAGLHVVGTKTNSGDGITLQDCGSWVGSDWRADFAIIGIHLVNVRDIAVGSYAALDCDDNGISIDTGSEGVMLGAGWVRNNGRATGDSASKRAGIFIGTDTVRSIVGPAGIYDDQGTATQTYPIYNLPATCKALFVASGHATADTIGGTDSGTTL